MTTQLANETGQSQRRANLAKLFHLARRMIYLALRWPMRSKKTPVAQLKEANAPGHGRGRKIKSV